MTLNVVEVIANSWGEGFGPSFDARLSDVGQSVRSGQSVASPAFEIPKWMNIVNYLPSYYAVLLCTRDSIAVLSLFRCGVEETLWSIHAYPSEN